MRRATTWVFGLMVLGVGSTRAENTTEARLAGPFEVEAIKDIEYFQGPEGSDPKQRLDLYVPQQVKNFPVVFFIHGGAWTSGDRKMYGSFGRVFAKNGIGAVIISYRLTPQVQHPGHIEDVARAFAWTYRNIAKYGGNPERIFVTGQSAGGHLAALLGTNDAFLKACQLTTRNIRGVMPISGIYQFTPSRMAEKILGSGEGAARSASPIDHVTGKEPPFVILYAENDFRGCDRMSRDLDDKLRQAKIESRLVEIKDRNHISIMFRAMLSETDATVQELLRFIEKHSDWKSTRKSEPAPTKP